MKRNILPAAAVAGCLGLIGCAGLGTQQVTAPPPGTVYCDSPVLCKIQVYVDNCKVSVVPEYVGLPRGHPNVIIMWTIETSGYEYLTDGIKFKTPGWENEFDHPSHAPTQFTMRDLNPTGLQRGRKFDYAVKVKPTNGAACPVHDPGIVNDM